MKPWALPMPHGGKLNWIEGCLVTEGSLSCNHKVYLRDKAPKIWWELFTAWSCIFSKQTKVQVNPLQWYGSLMSVVECSTKAPEDTLLTVLKINIIHLMTHHWCQWWLQARYINHIWYQVACNVKWSWIQASFSPGKASLMWQNPWGISMHRCDLTLIPTIRCQCAFVE